MKHTLLIWELGPGVETELYLIPDSEITEEGRKALVDSWGCYLDGTNNTDWQDEALQIIAAATSVNDVDVLRNAIDAILPEHEKWVGCWAQYKQGWESPIENVHIGAVYSSGIFFK